MASYTREDVQAARSNLQLLKKRISSKGPPLDRGNSHAAEIEKQSNQMNVVNQNKRNAQFNHVPRPGAKSVRPDSGVSSNPVDEVNQY